MRLVVLGLNHRTAPLDMRERIAFVPEEASDALDRFRDDGSVAEMAIVSTCNRTEFYMVAEDPDAAVDAQVALLHDLKGVDLSDGTHTYRHEQRECVRHLFRVAGGIDSMVIGETGILGQVKEAFELAQRRDTVGPYFGKLFPIAFRVGKRSRSETGIGRGAGSVAKAGISLAGKVFGNLDDRSALVIGAGETGAHVAALLREAGIRRLVVTNRTEARAREVADRENGQIVPFESFDAEIPKANAVFCAIHATEPLLTPGRMAKAIGRRKGSPLLVVDLGVPRNVDPKVGDLENVFLYGVDDLQELVNLNVGRRENEVPAVERIVDEELDRYWEWIATLAAKPVLVAMRREVDRMRREMLDKFGRSVSDEERQLLERFSNGFMNRVLHQPTMGVRTCDPGTPQGRIRLEWTRLLFGLDDPARRNGALGDDDEETA